MKRGFTIALMAAALVIVCAPIAGAHRASYFTTVVEDDATSPSEPPSEVIGHLESPKHACVKDRTVKLLARTDEGTRVVIDTDRSNDRGKWTVSGDLSNTHDERIRATRKRLPKHHHHRSTCEAGSTSLLF